MNSPCAGRHGREIRRLCCVTSTSAEAFQVLLPSLPLPLSWTSLGHPPVRFAFGGSTLCSLPNVTMEKQLPCDMQPFALASHAIGFLYDFCCAVPFDLVLNLRRLKQIIKKSTVEEEREVIEKALRKSEMLEVSKDGQLIHNKDIKSERASTVLITVLALTACCMPARRAS